MLMLTFSKSECNLSRRRLKLSMKSEHGKLDGLQNYVHISSLFNTYNISHDTKLIANINSGMLEIDFNKHSNITFLVLFFNFAKKLYPKTTCRKIQ